MLTVEALYEMQRNGGRYTLVNVCMGSGHGTAAIFERKQQRHPD